MGLFTTEEIYKFASEHSESQLEAIINKMESKEFDLYNDLLKLGDSKGVAVFTAISEKYKEQAKEEYSKYYN